MSGPLHADICFQERLIIPGVNIKVKLVRAADNFCLVAGGENPAYKVLIQEAVLRIRRVTVSPTLRLDRLWKSFADSGNLISREDYAKGYALYAIDLMPDRSSYSLAYSMFPGTS